MTDKIQRTARRLVTMLADRDFAGLASWSKGVRLTQSEMASAVNEYGRTIVVPPGQVIPNLDVVKVENVSDDANMYPGWRFENVATLVPFEGRGGVGRGNARKLRGESK